MCDQPDSVLRFEREEEAGCEVLDVVDASDMIVGQLKAEVAVGENNEVPDSGEDDPGNDEGGREAEQGPRPGKVDHRGEEVFEKPAKTRRRLGMPLEKNTIKWENS